ncbi:hypothetical protein [Leucobacter komagatae]|uniref:hypothetical protein n=1 Tax=Leucobacter komagatae TaxID=55969 RepID=UPI0011533050|nr:hypothetical protein [Leucobacter komagatae]
MDVANGSAREDTITVAPGLPIRTEDDLLVTDDLRIVRNGSTLTHADGFHGFDMLTSEDRTATSTGSFAFDQMLGDNDEA